MRLIDGDALMEAINTHPKFGVDERGRIVLWNEGYQPYIHLMDVVIAITGTPTVEPERKNGEWEEIEVIADAYDISGVKTWASKMKCNQCGFTTIAIEGHFSQYNFCPNCGADMRTG